MPRLTDLLGFLLLSLIATNVRHVAPSQWAASSFFFGKHI
jgi:hypothetical protein